LIYIKKPKWFVQIPVKAFRTKPELIPGKEML